MDPSPSNSNENRTRSLPPHLTRTRTPEVPGRIELRLPSDRLPEAPHSGDSSQQVPTTMQSRRTNTTGSRRALSAGSVPKKMRSTPAQKRLRKVLPFLKFLASLPIVAVVVWIAMKLLEVLEKGYW